MLPDTLEDKLKIAREIWFKRSDVVINDKITPSELGPLMIETYKSMGINYSPSKREINAWLK